MKPKMGKIGETVSVLTRLHGGILLLGVVMLLVFASPVYAVDPPKFLTYKKRFIAGLPHAYKVLDRMYNARFVTLEEGQGSTINKSGVYYDSIKSLHEFGMLCHDRRGLSPAEVALLDRIPVYIEKSKRIIAQRYIQCLFGGSGYQAFPHGLGYIYQSTGDREAYDALVDLRNEGNWLTGYNGIRESIVYTRDVAYSLQIGITALKCGIPHTTDWDDLGLIRAYLDLALSALKQWNTGAFYDTSQYRSSFMAGLTMQALIEYHERIDPDPRIPPAIKHILDDMWVTVWHPDVTDPPPSALGDSASYSTQAAEGAFWTWADWDSGASAYIIDRNHNPHSSDVSATHNMLIGPAYAWYAVYSGDKSYMDKAVDIFHGTAFNLTTYSPEGQLWQGSRYTHNFIRWYRAFYDTPCAYNNIEQCMSQADCAGAGGNWNGESCQYDSVAVPSTALTCETSPSLCSDENACSAAGYFFWDGVCHLYEENVTVAMDSKSQFVSSETSTITVTGTTTNASSVSCHPPGVNHGDVNAFSFQIPLSTGSNTLTVTASDGKHQEASAVTIIRLPCVVEVSIVP